MWGSKWFKSQKDASDAADQEDGKPFDTAEHARQVVACSQGQDMWDMPYAALPSPRNGFDGDAAWVPGHPWKSYRPLETGLPSPMVRFPASWEQQRGRFCNIGLGHGLGHQPLRLLRARRFGP